MTGATKPHVLVYPVIRGRAKKKARLQALPGTWTGTAPLVYEYQWQACTSSKRKHKLVWSCRRIAGATASSFVISPKYVGKRLEVSVTASDAAGSLTVTSKQTTVVAK